MRKADRHTGGAESRAYDCSRDCPTASSLEIGAKLRKMGRAGQRQRQRRDDTRRAQVKRM